MPGLDGFQVMDEMREIEPDGYLPVLVTTAQPDHKVRALQAGATDFISKPLEMAEVLARVHNMLEGRLLYKQLEHHSLALESLALRDALTDSPKRRLLMDRLSLAIAHARRCKCALAVMYLDLDEFKQVNDTLGHDAGARCCVWSPLVWWPQCVKRTRSRAWGAMNSSSRCRN